MAITLSERLDLLSRLGGYLSSNDERLLAYMQRSQYHNPWFTLENQQKAAKAIAADMLNREKLESWAGSYGIPQVQASPKTIGIVMAGNIPLVGFQDLLCVLVAGHHALVKLSDKDKFLLPHLVSWLGEQDERMAAMVRFDERLSGFDGVIATGSNNAYRYFEAYFGKKPAILRKNRNSVAVLTGEETPEQLQGLAGDIFQFFGLGCRNVSKIYVPRNYNFEPLLEALHESRDIILHDKYKNNFDYNYAMFVLNKVDFQNTGSLILQENPSLLSRIACLHYEFYDDMAGMEQQLNILHSDIQCLVSAKKIKDWDVLPFGSTQHPGLNDYPDGVDIMEFLLGL